MACDRTFTQKAFKCFEELTSGVLGNYGHIYRNPFLPEVIISNFIIYL